MEAAADVLQLCDLLSAVQRTWIVEKCWSIFRLCWSIFRPFLSIFLLFSISLAVGIKDSSLRLLHSLKFSLSSAVGSRHSMRTLFKNTCVDNIFDA